MWRSGGRSSLFGTEPMMTPSGKLYCTTKRIAGGLLTIHLTIPSMARKRMVCIFCYNAIFLRRFTLVYQVNFLQILCHDTGTLFVTKTGPSSAYPSEQLPAANSMEAFFVHCYCLKLCGEDCCHAYVTTRSRDVVMSHAPNLRFSSVTSGKEKSIPFSTDNHGAHFHPVVGLIRV